MGKQTNINSDYREEERLTCVLVLDSFNSYINEIVSHTTLPLCLWPVDGQSLLDYTIHTLMRSGIQEIILLATSNSYEIRTYLMNSHWLKTYPKLIRLIPCKDARSLGDCLKDLEQENIINNHFLLIYGNGTLITNEKLNNLFNIHKENIKKDKNCIMTLVYRQLESNQFEHPSFTDDQHLYIIRDSNTHRLYDYSKEYLDTYEIPLDLLEKPNVTIETLYCPLDCHLAVCSTDVLHLFKDNFDFLTINEFVKGVLRDEEIAGHTIYSYLYETGYFLSVHNLRLYMKATFDILRRWSYPLVPEIIASMHKPLVSSTVTTPTSPQIKSNDSYTSFHNMSYPIVYDKHNIYKQGDIQLDRLSNIQKDVFIGNKSQILSGVCISSSLIGQNCIIGKNSRIENSIIWNHVQIGENCHIKNSIICDNVLIRNNVQINKECILCKGVIIGTNAQLKERITIIASNSITSTKPMDDVEIDEDIQLPPVDFKRSNSKQSRSSTRLSDKSLPSSIEETITSNIDLVGSDGLGKELIFSFLHEHQTKSFQATSDDDDDDDDEDDDNDEKLLNPFDAWGYRIENKDLSIDDNEDNNERPSKPFVKQPSIISDDDDDDDDDETSGTSGSSTATESHRTDDEGDVSEFQEEVIRTLERAYLQKLKKENIIVELNMLKPTYDVSPTEFDQSITRAVFLLPFEKKITNIEKPNYWNTLKLTMDQITQDILKNYMKTTNEEAQMTLLNELDLICLKFIQPIGERIVNILNYLYEKDVLVEEWILKWYKNKQEKIQKNELVIKPEEKIYYDKLKQFIEWLQNAESEDDDDDDED
ncbi:unnamed protein product [Adineta steineri]|uniref:Translation initiation factor eIF2B subunit epsilon n=1 Tax=Adineta steineri TaxID=433720 RepID=A0A813PAN8_9BILA|nr:unnamed protein product [Adineta steineri]CAF0822822.1 unnamed protein product [Adineta steineri]CAF0863292.1 unnamed protein product [Adineta steineri]